MVGIRLLLEICWDKHASFDQDLSDWNLDAVQFTGDGFLHGTALSEANKGLMHESFASNPNWPYDWRQHIVIDDSNFQPAVNLWFDNQAEANATYGHISDWNVSAVTDMSERFEGRTTFNEDISNWDVSNVGNGGNDPLPALINRGRMGFHRLEI